MSQARSLTPCQEVYPCYHLKISFLKERRLNITGHPSGDIVVTDVGGEYREGI